MKVEDKNIHVVLDIETLGTKSGSAIVQIGAICLNPNLVESKLFFTKTIDLTSNHGMIMDFDTVRWWILQNEFAQHVVFDNKNQTSLVDALYEFNKWLFSCTTKHPGLQMWGYGADFDNALLKAAYDVCGINPYWTYKENMCLRTFAKLYPEVARIKPEIPHIAINDAIAQAEWLEELLFAHGIILPNKIQEDQIKIEPVTPDDGIPF